MAYEFKTTFLMDFNIAEQYGIEAVKDTFKRAFNEWKTNYTFLYELTLIMNWKSWYHYEKNNIEISKLYAKYFCKLCEYGMKNLKGKEREDFYKKFILNRSEYLLISIK